MSGARQLLFGGLLALLLIIIVIGSISLALIEGGRLVAQAPTFTATYIERSFPTFINIVPGQPSITPVPSDTPLIQHSPTPTLTPQCVLPEGWIEIVIQPGDTLDTLAEQFGIDRATLASMNCMDTDTMLPGATFYVPGPSPSRTPSPLPSPTFTQRAPVCGPPSTWVLYTVRPGDTLYALSRVLGVSIYSLQQANCMGNSVTLYVGDRIWVPFYPPLPSWTPVPSYTPTWTRMPTFTPTQTSVVFPSATATPIPTNTQLPTHTPVPSDTPLPTQTNTFTPQYSPTITNTSPPPTVTPTPTKKPSQTMIPTHTSTPIPTFPYP